MNLHGLVDYILPESCLVCTLPIVANREGSYPVCSDCVGLLPRFTSNRCLVCGEDLISEISVCMRCRARSYRFERNISVFPFRGIARTLVHAYKFQGVRRLASLFADEILSTIERHRLGHTVVPVPPRPRRRRNVDAVERIARILERSGSSVIRCLERRPGIPQKTLDYAGRLENLRGAFSLTDSKLPRRCVLLDDVFTTGATTDECADVLCSAGVEAVTVVTVALD